MNYPSRSTGECWAYDISSAVDLALSALREVPMPFSGVPESLRNPTHEELVNRWIDHTLTAGRIIEAVGHRSSPWEKIYTQLEQFAPKPVTQTLDQAASLLWREVTVPWYCSGCQFIKHRERGVLWVVYLDPQISHDKS